jgi:hypothetical protein
LPASREAERIVYKERSDFKSACLDLLKGTFIDKLKAAVDIGESR